MDPDRAGSTESHPDLLPILAHELAQPVTAALGLALTVDARFDDLQETAKRDANVGVIRNLKQIKMLIENLRLFSNMDSGQLPLKRTSISMRELLDNAVEDFRERFASRIVMVECDRFLRVNADIMLLRQVLANILANAVKFSEKHSTIEIHARPSGNELVVTVKNEGMGFPSVERKRIFERTVRLDSASPGLGFGLFVAKEIVNAHGGRIWAESEPGQGAVFNVALPAWPIVFSNGN